MSKLYKDVLYIILEELDDDIKYSSLIKTKKSLHSCLLVNRLWCETAVSILWKNPWKFVINNKRLFDIIISCLSRESQNFLKSKRIDLFPILHENPLFDYIRYCNHIDFHRIRHCIEEGFRVKFMNHFHSLSLDWNDTEFNWIRYCTNKRSRNDDLDVEIRVKLTNHFHIIEKEIYKLLMGSCLIVKNLDTGNVMEHSETPMYYYYLTRTNVSLGNLTVLCCDSNIDHTFFHELAHACSLLQRLHIFNCNSDNPGLARLIEVQKNLKYLACLTDYDAEMLIVPPLEAIGSALITQADSLVHFKFVYNLEFFLPLNILTELSSNLQRLDLINFNIDYGDSRSEQMYNNHKFEELLKLTTFSKLEVFKVGIINLDVAIKVIEQTEGNLSEVLLGYSDYNERYSGSYIRAIYECCPKIQILSLGINKGDFKEFENLLIKCQQIQRMVIETYNFDDDHIKLILEILLKSSPKTLREIRISWRYCKTDLKSFLENWKDRVRITLYFFVENHYEKYYFDMNYSKVLDHFREVGVVKAYRYDDMYQNFYMLN